VPDILHRVGINTAPDRVFQSLTTVEGLREWWIAQATGDAGPGGTVDFGFCDMRVAEAAPNRLVRWDCVRGPEEWVGTRVSFELAWRNGQTFVVFKHADWKEPVEFMHHCSTKWATFLLSLRDALEKSDGHPAPRDVKIHVGD